MLFKDFPLRLLNEIKSKIESYDFLVTHRKTPTAFSRMRILEFKDVMYTVMNLIKGSISIELFKYFDRINKDVDVTDRAFNDARQKISHKAFEELFFDGVRGAMEIEDTRLFCGYRPLGIDGTTVLLEYSEPLKKRFGKTTPSPGDVYARVSTCTDVLNGFVVDALICPYSTGERKLAKQHIKNVSETSALFLMDRGYWSTELIARIVDNCQKFVMRLAANSIPAVVESEQNNGHITICHHRKNYVCRYYKFQLKSGEMEYLLTNLPEDEVSDLQLPDLYWLRWGIETKYSEIKEKLQIENLSGKSPLFVLQDFYATLWVINMICFMVLAAETEIPDRKRKYAYKPNKNFSIGVLRHSFISMVVDDDPDKRGKKLQRLITRIRKRIIPIRPDRPSRPRTTKRTKQRKVMSKKSPL